MILDIVGIGLIFAFTCQTYFGYTYCVPIQFFIVPIILAVLGIVGGILTLIGGRKLEKLLPAPMVVPMAAQAYGQPMQPAQQPMQAQPMQQPMAAQPAMAP